MRTILFAAATILVTVVTTVAHACICSRPGSAAEGRDVSAAVFDGHVVAISKSRRSLPGYGRLDDHKIKVHRVWKGRIGTTATVVSSATVSCGLSIPVGTDFLIYAEEKSGILFTHICTRTQPMEADAAKQDVVELGRPTRTHSRPCEAARQGKAEGARRGGAVQHGVAPANPAAGASRRIKTSARRRACR